MESDETFECLKNIFSEWNRICNDFLNTESSFLNGINPLLKKIRTEKEGHDKNHFNIFSKISEIYCPDKAVYEKENPNSEILKLLLNPKTEKIGDEKVLKSFFKFIDMPKYSDFFPDFNDIEILREKHRMDIYIRNKENAVIIESKLNGAPHQDFQLARYYLEATNRDKLTVQKIVYLTLNPIGKLNLGKLYKPSPSKKYTTEEQNEYYNTVTKIQPLITYISAVDGDKSLSNFFKDCSKKSGINGIRKILLEEYSELLVKLAGEERMTSAEKVLFEKIYANEDDIKSAKEFINVWNVKNEALHYIFKDKFEEKNKTEKKGWVYYDDMYYKNVNGYILFIYFYHDKNGPFIQIGFWSGKDKPKFKKQKRDDLKDVLESLAIDNLGLELTSDGIRPTEEWVYMDFVYDEYKNINDYFDKIIDVLDELENKTSQLK